MKNSTVDGRIFTDQYCMGHTSAMAETLQVPGSSRDMRLVAFEQTGGRTFAV